MIDGVAIRKLPQEDGVKMKEGKMGKDEVASGTIAKAVIEIRIEPIKGTGTSKGTKKATEAETKAAEATREVLSNVLESVTVDISHRFTSTSKSVISNDVINENMIDFAY